MSKLKRNKVREAVSKLKDFKIIAKRFGMNDDLADDISDTVDDILKLSNGDSIEEPKGDEDLSKAIESTIQLVRTIDADEDQDLFLVLDPTLDDIGDLILRAGEHKQLSPVFVKANVNAVNKLRSDLASEDLNKRKFIQTLRLVLMSIKVRL